VNWKVSEVILNKYVKLWMGLIP